ncbi:hypothetical protein [Mycobacterium sp. NAZ190054]|uniref:hypothetical protein n=1 Tax=Mycobacterium sp. NAZ190054 TaxID=1747766 RepID=UPI000799C76E|nr:hypothetical protein [Mycobacterium sp. NAZ190054]KWX67550.1 hypothetical protein ASJ79_21440 [Mycobacterium sp. NAZ190054]
MSIVSRYAPALVVGLGVAAVLTAPTATAAPDCADIGKTVTFCETNGSTQITTTPPPWNYGGWSGIGVWPLVGAYGLGPW